MSPFEIVVPKLREAPEVNLYDLEGKVVASLRLPSVFTVPVRLEIVRRAHHAALTASLQPQGRDPLAGKRRVGESWGVGHSVARVPRLQNGRAVIAPMVRGGRRAHAPVVDKNVVERINRGEKIYAIASALAAASMREYAASRGHLVPENLTLPVVLVDDVENLGSAADARRLLRVLGLWNDVERSRRGTRIRAGKGKMRGRRYVEPKSLLAIFSRGDVAAVRAFRNLPGVDVAYVGILSVIHLAPGGVPGRLILMSKSALEMLGNRFRVIYI